MHASEVDLSAGRETTDGLGREDGSLRESLDDVGVRLSEEEPLEIGRHLEKLDQGRGWEWSEGSGLGRRSGGSRRAGFGGTSGERQARGAKSRAEVSTTVLRTAVARIQHFISPVSTFLPRRRLSLWYLVSCPSSDPPLPSFS